MSPDINPKPSQFIHGEFHSWRNLRCFFSRFVQFFMSCKEICSTVSDTSFRKFRSESWCYHDSHSDFLRYHRLDSHAGKKWMWKIRFFLWKKQTLFRKEFLTPLCHAVSILVVLDRWSEWIQVNLEDTADWLTDFDGRTWRYGKIDVRLAIPSNSLQNWFICSRKFCWSLWTAF